MARMEDNKYTKIRPELEKNLKDIAKNVEYRSHIGCKEGEGKNEENKDGDEKIKKEEEE